MKERKMIMILFVVVLISASYAHQPEGTVYPAIKWRDDSYWYPPPLIDGDFLFYSAIPAEYWIPLSISGDRFGFDRSPDEKDMGARVFVSWSEEENRVYVAIEWWDDYWDGGELASEDQRARYGDYFTMIFDGDHGGESVLPTEDEFPDEDERRLNRGRWAQSYWQPIPGSPHFEDVVTRVSETTWHDMAYQFNGELGGEGVLWIEFSRVMWDDFIRNDPQASVVTDLEEGNVIGLGWFFNDQDGDDEEKIWFSGGDQRLLFSSAYAMDFVLAGSPDWMYEGNGGDKSVAGMKTWGRIKRSFWSP